MYSYLCEARRQGAEPTAAASFKSALSFAGGVFGLDGAIEAAKSRRVIGLVQSEFVKKRPLLQRPPLTVAMVI